MFRINTVKKRKTKKTKQKHEPSVIKGDVGGRPWKVSTSFQVKMSHSSIPIFIQNIGLIRSTSLPFSYHFETHQQMDKFEDKNGNEIKCPNI